MVGLVLQVSSILMDATRCCYLQKVLQLADVKVTPLVTLCPRGALLSSRAVPPHPGGRGRPAVGTEDGLGQCPCRWYCLSGVLASALNLVIFKIIALTSALTTSLSGVIKEWVCILVAMYVYDTRVTALQWTGYSIAIAGLLWYQMGKIGAADADLAAGKGLPAIRMRSTTKELPVYMVQAGKSGPQPGEAVS